MAEEELSPSRAVQVSTLVTAYNKSPYLEPALRSVFGQCITPDPHELVILTSQPSYVAEVLARINVPRGGWLVRIVESKHSSLGPFCMSGLQSCSNDIVAILNDDDLWLRDRLKVVQGAFARDPDLVFFKNRVSFIDGSGQALTGYQRRRALRPPPTDYDVTVSLRDRNWRKLRYLAAYEPGFNSSSIAIDKRAVLALSEVLSHLRSGDDLFYFYSSLATGRNLRFMSVPLTRYRIHGKNTSGVGRTLGRSLDSTPNMASNYQLETVRCLLASVTLPEAVTALLHGEESYLTLLQLIKWPTSDWGSFLRKIYRVAPGLLAFHGQLNCLLLVVAFLTKVAGQAGRAVYETFRA